MENEYSFYDINRNPIREGYYLNDREGPLAISYLSFDKYGVMLKEDVFGALRYNPYSEMDRRIVNGNYTLIKEPQDLSRQFLESARLLRGDVPQRNISWAVKFEESAAFLRRGISSNDLR